MTKPLHEKTPEELIKELAEKLEVAFSTVNRWFNRKSVPRKMQSYHIQKLLRS